MTKRPTDKKSSDTEQSGPEKPGHYAVGYKKPPVKSQFKKGVSGNPKGRPVGSRNIIADIRAAFSTPITIRQGEKMHRISTLEALSRKQLEMALKGDHRAAIATLKMAKEIGLLEQPEAPLCDLSKLTDDELEEFERLCRKVTPGAGK